MENNQEVQTNSQNTLFVLLVFAIVLILVGGAYWYGRQNIMDTSEEIEEGLTQEVPEAEVVVVEETEESTQPVEEESTIAEDLIVLLSEKLEVEPETLIITINENTGQYAMGSIGFTDAPMGAAFLAAKVDDERQLVFDGNGTVPCENLEEVDFPIDMMPECWDEENMGLMDKTVQTK